MAEDRDRWDAETSPSAWLQPGERVLWRGRPDARVIFARQDAYLVPVSVVWTGFFAVMSLSGHLGPRGGIGLGAVPFLAFGAYLVLGRFVTKVLGRRRTRYAITNQRAVELSASTVMHSVDITSSLKLLPRRDRRHGSLIWQPGAWTKWDPAHTPRRGRRSSDWLDLRGTAWPGSRRYDSAGVAMIDMGDYEAAVGAARRARFELGVVEQLPAERAVRALQFPRWAGMGSPKAASHWLREKLRRRPYAIWSPLPPYEVARRLFENLSQVASPFAARGLGAREGSGARGRLTGSCLVVRGGASQRNAWSTEFDATITQEQDGTSLKGSLGPSALMPAFTIVWLGVASLLCVSSVIGFVSGVAQGHPHAASLVGSLVGAALLTIFVAVTAAGTRAAEREWVDTERWIRWLLESPPSQRLPPD
ncbi:MAG: hypothetical protein ACRD0Z_08040 [Acidimicrobiales bacterium]